MKISHRVVAIGALVQACGVSNAEVPFPVEGGAGAVTEGGGGNVTDVAASAVTGAGGANATGSGTAGAGGGAGAGGSGGAGQGFDAGPDAAAGTGGSAGSNATDGGRCPAIPTCDAAPPNAGAARGWRHTAPFGAANHRGRDLFVMPGAPQWIIGNFQYGLALLEGPLRDEEIDIYLLRNCGSDWEKLGTALTTDTPSRPKTEGVDDVSGRIFFEIPASKALAPGRHRIRLVVGGDLSAVEMFIEVVAPNTSVFVTDVDGTLTNSENAQTIAILTGTVPDPNPGAAEALNALAAKGFRPFYLTARPEWLVKTTQDWIVAKGFPPGIVHTTLVGGGATGAAATTFKTDELALLAAKPIKAVYAFGNTDSDADAYNNAAIQPLSSRIFFQYTDAAWNGRRIEAYGPLVAEFGALAPVCR